MIHNSVANCYDNFTEIFSGLQRSKASRLKQNYKSNPNAYKRDVVKVLSVKKRYVTTSL